MAQITKIEATDTDRVLAYAELVRVANREDFGAIAQNRSDSEFLNEINSAEGKLEWYTLAIAPDNPEVIGGIEIVFVDENRAQVFIRVLKALQGYGFGQEALAFVRERLRRAGVTTMMGTCATRSMRDNRNVRFLIKSGFEEVVMLLRQDVSLDVDPALWVAPQPEGVTIAVMNTGFPVEFIEQIVQLNRQFAAEAPEMAPQAIQLDNGPASAELYRRMETGGRRTIFGHALAPDGAVVGYCEAQVAPEDKLAEEYLTFVDREYRGRGVARAMKVAMLKEIRALGGSTTGVRVFLPADFTGSAGMNRSLGYTDTAFYRDWQRPVD